MGACCSSENQSRVDAKEARFNFAQLQNQVEENSNKDYMTGFSIEDFNLFKEKAHKITTNNNLVNELYKKLGAYPYNPNAMNTHTIRELKESTEIEQGMHYYGYWNSNKTERDGYGVMIWPDGSRYDGMWERNKENGHGRLINANGDVYIGEWVDDEANGKGEYHHQDGAVYIGCWKDDKQEGTGVET